MDDDDDDDNDDDDDDEYRIMFVWLLTLWID